MIRRLGVAKRSCEALGANAHLIGRPNSRKKLATPALILDLDALERNLRFMSRYCREHKTALRPHAKTHKSVHIAALQAQSGAVGICVATVREAIAMVKAGIKGLLITSPVVGEAKSLELTKLLEADKDVMLVVDSTQCVDMLERVLTRARKTAKVLIDIDLGMKRTGVSDVRGVVSLARRLIASNALHFMGVQCYSGLVQHIGPFSARAKANASELVLLEVVLERLAKHAIAVKIVSGGGTGTFDIDRKAALFSECQAGSYVFMDIQYNEVQILESGDAPFETSLFLQSTVLSNNHRGAATVDAGFKSFAMDGPLPVPKSGAPHGAQFEFRGDEFGMLLWSSKRTQLDLGAKVEFTTPHCDPTVNLHNFYHCVRGERLVDIWPVDARGHL